MQDSFDSDNLSIVLTELVSIPNISARMFYYLSLFLMAMALFTFLVRADMNSNAIVQQNRQIQQFHDDHRNISSSEEHHHYFAGARNLRYQKRRSIPSLTRPQSSASRLWPSVVPEEYAEAEQMFVYSRHVNSEQTQIPFGFEDVMKGCTSPKLVTHSRRQNIGARLQGLKLEPLPFQIHTQHNTTCTTLCQTTNPLNNKMVLWLRTLIESQYRFHMILDNLSVLTREYRDSGELLKRGVPIGFEDDDTSDETSGNEAFYLYNHFKFSIFYREIANSFRSKNGIHITGFEVEPFSIAHDSVTLVPGKSSCRPRNPMIPNNDSLEKLRLELSNDLSVTYSYEVNWILSEHAWSDRWEVYLQGNPSDNLHLLSVINSFISVILTSIFSMFIIKRSLSEHHFIKNLKNDEANLTEDKPMKSRRSNWTELRGDVFRPPSNKPGWLSAMVAIGIQLGCSAVAVIVFTIAGWIQHQMDGVVVTSLIHFYLVCGIGAGYVNARLCKFFDIESSLEGIAATAVGLPAFLLLLGLVPTALLHLVGAANAIGFDIIFNVFLPCTISLVGLIIIGTNLGHVSGRLNVPVKTNASPFASATRKADSWHDASAPHGYCLLAGMLSFWPMICELRLSLGALWSEEIFYRLDLLLAMIVLLTVSCAINATTVCCLQLYMGNHCWWWISFASGATTGLYVFLYSLWLLWSSLKLVGFLPVLVYLWHMSMLSICFSLFCGAAGFFGSFWFLGKIYGNLQDD